MIKKPYFTCALWLISTSYAPLALSTDSSSVDQFKQGINACAARYTGANEKLSPISKCAIVEHKSALAINVYEKACSLKYGVEIRKHYCPLSLLELAMFFSDSANDEKNFSKSREYIIRLTKEFPDSDAAKAANEFFYRPDHEEQ